MSLGEEYAGLFSNNDDLSNKIFDVGKKIGEKVWRLPLDENYNKLMNSPVADMQNINYSGWCRINNCSSIFTKIYN